VLKSDSDSVSQPPQREDPQIPIDGANQLVAKFSRLYAQAAPEDPTRAPSLDARHHPGTEGWNCEHGACKEEREADGRGV
jgi:hypothetical protein